MKIPTNVEKETDFQFVFLKYMYKTQLNVSMPLILKMLSVALTSPGSLLEI